MRGSISPWGIGRTSIRALQVAIVTTVALVAASGVARAQNTVTFRWEDPVPCGPNGTLRFDSHPELVLFDPRVGRFEFTGTAKENSRRLEAYTITLTFRDRDDVVLFRFASEPFEMEPGRRSDFLVFGQDRRIADFWDDIDAVELDAQVPGEPLFEDAFDEYGRVLQYFREQELEAVVFRDF